MLGGCSFSPLSELDAMASLQEKRIFLNGAQRPSPSSYLPQFTAYCGLLDFYRPGVRGQAQYFSKPAAHEKDSLDLKFYQSRFKICAPLPAHCVALGNSQNLSQPHPHNKMYSGYCTKGSLTLALP